MKDDEITIAEIAMALKRFRENIPMLSDLFDMEAKRMRIQYDAMLRHGFTPEQAMYACVHPK